MTEREPWLGHLNGCPVQWGEACSCPCPSCGVLLDTPPPASCPQFAHKAVGRPPHEDPQYLPKAGGRPPRMNWHVTDENPTHHRDQCGETEPFTRREFHMCCLSTGHEDEHECRACDATWGAGG